MRRPDSRSETHSSSTTTNGARLRPGGQLCEAAAGSEGLFPSNHGIANSWALTLLEGGPPLDRRFRSDGACCITRCNGVNGGNTAPPAVAAVAAASRFEGAAH